MIKGIELSKYPLALSQYVALTTDASNTFQKLLYFSTSSPAKSFFNHYYRDDWSVSSNMFQMQFLDTTMLHCRRALSKVLQPPQKTGMAWRRIYKTALTFKPLACTLWRQSPTPKAFTRHQRSQEQPLTSTCA